MNMISDFLNCIWAAPTSLWLRGYFILQLFLDFQNRSSEVNYFARREGAPVYLGTEYDHRRTVIDKSATEF